MIDTYEYRLTCLPLFIPLKLPTLGRGTCNAEIIGAQGILAGKDAKVPRPTLDLEVDDDSGVVQASARGGEAAGGVVLDGLDLGAGTVQAENDVAIVADLEDLGADDFFGPGDGGGGVSGSGGRRRRRGGRRGEEGGGGAGDEVEEGAALGEEGSRVGELGGGVAGEEAGEEGEEEVLRGKHADGAVVVAAEPGEGGREFGGGVFDAAVGGGDDHGGAFGGGRRGGGRGGGGGGEIGVDGEEVEVHLGGEAFGGGWGGDPAGEGDEAT